MGYDKQKRIPFSRGEGFGPVEAATTGGTIKPYGVTTITRKSSAGASTQIYILPASKRAGVEKTIICLNATSTRACRVTTSAASYQSSGNSTSLTKAHFKSGSAILRLIALSTAKWVPIGGSFTTVGAASLARSVTFD